MKRHISAEVQLVESNFKQAMLLTLDNEAHARVILSCRAYHLLELILLNAASVARLVASSSQITTEHRLRILGGLLQFTVRHKVALIIMDYAQYRLTDRGVHA